MTDKRFDVVYEEDDEYKNIRYWEIIDTKSQNSTSNELEIVNLLNELDERWIGELNLRETLQLDLQRVEEENKELKNKINTYKSANKLQQETIRLLREDNGLINITNVELFKLEDEDD